MAKLDFETVFPKLVKIQLFRYFDERSEDDRRILRELHERLVLREFRKGDVIIREGDEGKSLFILLDGRVQISRATPSGDSFALADLSAEQNVFFGENALISDDRRSASITAETPCRTYELERDVFKSFCQKEPSFGYRVAICLAKRMAETIKKTNSDIATLYEALCSEIDGDF